MKVILFIIILMFSQSVVAKNKICNGYPEIEDAQINMLDEEDSAFSETYFSFGLTTQKIKSIFEKYHGDLLVTENYNCYEMVRRNGIRSNETSNVFEAYYTHDDECDGGNSYGFIIDKYGKVVSTINDGDSYCIETK